MSLDFVPLGEVADITKLAGFEFTKYIDYLEYGEIIALRALNLRNGTLDLTDVKYISKEVSESLPRSKLYKNDILLTYTGNGYGDCAIVKENDKYHLAPNIAKITPKKINPYFLFEFINSGYFRRQMRNFIGGSSQPTIPMKTLRILEVPLPDKNTQNKIAKILSELDKKITINQEINKNLENQLLKIFDSWFVKFELSEEFTDSHIGAIPKGWAVDYLGSKKSCSIIGSGIEDFDDSKIYIATADVDNSIIINNETLITIDEKPSRANMQPIEKSIWFAKMIDSRKLIMVDDYCYDLLNHYIFSTGFCGLKCEEDYFYYLWTFLLSDTFDTIKNNFCTGTTMQAINNKDTQLIEFVLPDAKILSKFNEIAEPMYKKIYYNNLEIRNLQKLRDTLLPKLMSGEIDVSKINCDL